MISLLKIFTTVELSKCSTIEQDAVKNAMEKEDKMSKNARLVKEKVSLFKCIKWDQECISKSRNIAINVLGKVKLFQKAENARIAMVKRSLRRLKHSKFQSKRVLLTIIP